ncbi:MAG: glutamate mutase L [Candidatus Competibacteraceae bacterium]
MDANKRQIASSGIRIAVDIGSTVVKIARVGTDNRLLSQQFYPRDFKAGIARQVESLLGRFECKNPEKDILICSSANGGLRVGISCLTQHFSGAELRNQVLLAGANPIFVHDFDEDGSSASFVDILLVGGGIDCEDAAPLAERVRRFRPENYRFGSLFYAGNRYLAALFLDRFPHAVVIPNPLAEGLRSKTNSVFEVVRRAYLDDLVYKEGVSELGSRLSDGIRPTPEVVNRGFQRMVFNRSSIEVTGPCILVDIGGATTDIHYTVEIIRDDSEERSSAASSIARYVFTDLGIVASCDTTLQQLRTHPRVYEFLGRVLDDDVREVYRLLREGEYSPSPELLSYGCLFLGLDRFAQGRGPGLPAANLDKVAQIILTGGAAQNLEVGVVARVIDMMLADGGSNPRLMIDKDYQIWVDGITWCDYPPV